MEYSEETPLMLSRDAASPSAILNSSKRNVQSLDDDSDEGSNLELRAADLFRNRSTGISLFIVLSVC